MDENVSTIRLNTLAFGQPLRTCCHIHPREPSPSLNTLAFGQPLRTNGCSYCSRTYSWSQYPRIRAASSDERAANRCTSCNRVSIPSHSGSLFGRSQSSCSLDFIASLNTLAFGQPLRTLRSMASRQGCTSLNTLAFGQPLRTRRLPRGCCTLPRSQYPRIRAASSDISLVAGDPGLG